MSFLTLDLAWLSPPASPTAEEIFAAWVNFGGDSLLSEFTEAYLRSAA